MCKLLFLKDIKILRLAEGVANIFIVCCYTDMGDADDRKTKRNETIKPLLDTFWSSLKSTKPVGGSGLQKDVNYVLNNKDKLSLFLSDGHIELTNNRAERAVRPFVIGGKNPVFRYRQRCKGKCTVLL